MPACKRKILIVDDDADFTEAVSFFLETHNYAVLKARDGSEGLQLAKMERPDLILIDVMMSERTEGFFTLQEIRRVPGLKDLPVFVLTALYTRVPGFRIPPEGGWLGHNEFFAKPIDLPQLLEAIRRHLGEDALPNRTSKEVQA